MTKMHKILLEFLSAFLIIAVTFGIITKLSYVQVNADNAIVSYVSTVDEFIYDRLDKDDILKQLEKVECAFIVTVKHSEKTYQCTKTTVVVDRASKGDSSLEGKEIIIYEPNFIDYYKTNNTMRYYDINCFNNLMQENKQYLVFCDEMNYAESYKKTLTSKEFKVDIELKLYSFPINEDIKHIEDISKDRFSEVATYDYFCFSESQANHLEDIRNEVFEKYL